MDPRKRETFLLDPHFVDAVLAAKIGAAGIRAEVGECGLSGPYMD
jgi:hypothetical protein